MSRQIQSSKRAYPGGLGHNLIVCVAISATLISSIAHSVDARAYEPSYATTTVPASSLPSDVLRVFHATALVRGVTAYEECGYQFGTLWEYRTPDKWRHTTFRISDADKLNGMSARDQYMLAYRFSRSYEGGHWFPWVEIHYAEGGFYVQRTTTNGVVKYTSTQCRAPKSLP
jgi:hypothetical protein